MAKRTIWEVILLLLSSVDQPKFFPVSAKDADTGRLFHFPHQEFPDQALPLYIGTLL